ncbi:MAG: hypothetical protein U5R48_13295 [Gammaproteobacteria bacterium]|nr:hypothetical protein [Gammaproteobacteria bacterium]
MTSTGINFQWAELSDAQKAELETGAPGLGEDRLLYLRGDRSNERSTADQAKPFRQRDSVLGDIVNSNSQFVGTRDFGYGNLGPNDAFADAVGAGLPGPS